MSKRMSVRPKLMVYLTEHIGETVHLETIMSDLDLDRGQVQQGMLHFSDKGIVEIVIRGNSWRYQPKPDVPPQLGDLATVQAVASGPIAVGQVVEAVQTPGDLFEVIKCLNDGRLLLQDDQGDLFVAKRLET